MAIKFKTHYFNSYLIGCSIIKIQRSHAFVFGWYLLFFFSFSWNFEWFIIWDPMHREYFGIADCMSGMHIFGSNVWIECLKNHKLQHCQLNSTNFITVHFTNPQQIHQFEMEKMNFNYIQASVVAQKLQTHVYLSGIPFRWNELPHKQTNKENRGKMNTWMSIATKIKTQNKNTK